MRMCFNVNFKPLEEQESYKESTATSIALAEKKGHTPLYSFNKLWNKSDTTTHLQRKIFLKLVSFWCLLDNSTLLGPDHQAFSTHVGPSSSHACASTNESSRNAARICSFTWFLPASQRNIQQPSKTTTNIKAVESFSCSIPSSSLIVLNSSPLHQEIGGVCDFLNVNVLIQYTMQWKKLLP